MLISSREGKGSKEVEDMQAPPEDSNKSNIDQPSDTYEVEEISVSSPSACEETPSTPLEPSIAIPNGKNKLFGLNKNSPTDRPTHSTSSFNPFDYEQKYSKDRFGEEWGPNARTWLTYLDEADAYDRDKVEGWRDTVDVLLVFTGLFSAVVTTFVAQSSQSLQPDFTQVSASLLFEMVQLQRAQITGLLISSVPNSTLTPASPFNPSANAIFVNGLWFTSLAISLSAALFSVLAKQWLYYFMSTVPGTARDKARMRHFRFQGLDMWKVGFIIDFLPILIHLALGLFLVGLIMLVFPLDTRIGWTIIILSGMTYVFYFTSATLPIWYAECPYTTSLTILMGTVYHFLVPVFFKVVERYKRKLWPIDDLDQYLTGLPAPNNTIRLLKSSARKAERAVSSFVIAVRRHISGFAVDLRRYFAIDTLPVATQWRERKLEELVKTKEWLNIQVVHWLYTISTNPSIQRIIARCVGVYPEFIEESGRSGVRFDEPMLAGSLASYEANVEDYCHVLSLKAQCDYIDILFKRMATSIANASVNMSEEVYSCVEIARKVLQDDYVGILSHAFEDCKLRAPLGLWVHLLSSANKDAVLAARILCPRVDLNPFDWSSDFNLPSGGSTLIGVSNGTSGSKSLRRLGFKYLAGCFSDDQGLPSINEDIFFENCYNLFLAIYRNLTSDQPFITDSELREDCLEGLFLKLYEAIRLLSLSKLTEWITSWEHPNRFTRDVLCVDAYWGDRTTETVQRIALVAFDALWDCHIESTNDVLRFLLINNIQELKSVYRRCSQKSSNTLRNSHLVLQLFLPQNVENLITILREEPTNQAIINFRHCLRCLREAPWYGLTKHIMLERNYIIPNLLHLFKTMSPSHPLYSILSDKLILVQLWAYFDYHTTTSPSARDFLAFIESRFDSQDLKELYQLMVDEVLSEGGDEKALKSAYKLGRTIGFPTSELPLSISRFFSSVWNLSNGEELESRVTNKIRLLDSELEEENQKCSCFWSDLIVQVKQKLKSSSPATLSDSRIEV